MGASCPSLERCVGDVQRFLSDYWGRRTHLGAVPDDQEYRDLLSLPDVDHIVSTMALRAPAFRLVKDGATLPQARYTRNARIGSRSIDDLIDPGRVADLFGSGATIVLQGLHRYWPPVTRLCRDLERFLTHPVQANAYITPPSASGLRLHEDPHDVLALQTHGRKRWVVHPGDAGDPREPLDIELVAGQCLYLPMGTRHAAETVGAASVHLTIGIRANSWAAVTRRIMRAAETEPELSARLPAGYAHEPATLTRAMAEHLRSLARWVDQQDPAALAAAVADDFWSQRPPLLNGHLRDLLRLDDIDDDTLVAVREGATWRLRVEGTVLVLVLGDRLLRMPARVEPALRALLDRGPLHVGDLVDHLDADGRIVLCRRLVREGLLAIQGTATR